MGLFDHVHCEYPLPGLPDPGPVEFQTKDFPEPALMRYRISRVGRLMVKVGIGEEDTEYHGDLMITGLHPETGKYCEYRVRFTHGDVESVERLDQDPPAH